MAQTHLPVLYQEVLDALQPCAGGHYIDGTVGAGGHARGILEASAPDGQLVGFDRDPHALALAQAKLQAFGARARLVQASYLQMAEHTVGLAPVDGIVLDLGLSSLQLDNPVRGFAFQHDGPLDMRFDPTSGELTAADLVNTWPLDELADVLFEYGEEHASRAVARAIGAARPLTTTKQLAAVVAQALRANPKDKSHPATRTFQALRIAVNGELDAVEKVLPLAVQLLKPGGRLAVITFHSLEDRLVKNFMRAQARGPATDPAQPVPLPFTPTLREVTRKPLVASAAELARNPRARSAKLRVAEKLEKT